MMRSGFATALLTTLAACSTSSSPAAPGEDSGLDVAAVEAGPTDAHEAGADASTTPAFRVALSVSPFTATLLASGVAFSDGTRTATTAADLQKLYVAHGSNEVFVRVATEMTHPAGHAEDHSYAAAIAASALARSLGLPLNPELGLWANYGDVTCQPPPDFTGYPSLTLPGAWNTLTVDQMLPVLRAYGTLMAHAILDPGTEVRIWDIGNEVDFGTAGVAPNGINCSGWIAPDGVDPAIGTQTVLALLMMAEPARAAWLAAHVWPAEARLLSAVADGIRAVDPKARFATHISQATDTAFAQAFYQAMHAGGFSPDELGFSYYPSASASATRGADFRATVAAVRADFGKPVFIAEFAYPAGPIGGGAYGSWTHAFPSYPVSPGGQADLLQALASWGIASGVSGIRYWAPEVFVSGWGGLAIFAAPTTGPSTAGPAMDSIVKGIAAPNVSAFHD